MPTLTHQPRMVSDTHRLTRREQQLSDLLSSGLNDEQCAVAMGIKVKSVKLMRGVIRLKVADLAGMGK